MPEIQLRAGQALARPEYTRMGFCPQLIARIKTDPAFSDPVADYGDLLRSYQTNLESSLKIRGISSGKPTPSSRPRLRPRARLAVLLPLSSEFGLSWRRNSPRIAQNPGRIRPNPRPKRRKNPKNPLDFREKSHWQPRLQPQNAFNPPHSTRRTHHVQPDRRSHPHRLPARL